MTRGIHFTSTTLRGRLERKYPELVVNIGEIVAGVVTLADDMSIEDTRQARTREVEVAGLAGSFTERILADQTVTEACALLKMYADDLAADSRAAGVARLSRRLGSLLPH